MGLSGLSASAALGSGSSLPFDVDALKEIPAKASVFAEGIQNNTPATDSLSLSGKFRDGGAVLSL